MLQDQEKKTQYLDENASGIGLGIATYSAMMSGIADAFRLVLIDADNDVDFE